MQWKNPEIKMVHIISYALLEYLFAVGQRAFAASEVGSAIPQQPHDFYEYNPLFLLPYEFCSLPNQSQIDDCKN